jgi:hypothetical protein
MGYPDTGTGTDLNTGIGSGTSRYQVTNLYFQDSNTNIQRLPEANSGGLFS